jgi:chromosomal replication initiator protein
MKIHPYVYAGINPEVIDDNDLKWHRCKMAACTLFKINEEKLMARSRYRRIVWPRQMMMAWMRSNTDLTWKEIADKFNGKSDDGKKNHATVIHACKVVNNVIQVDKKARQEWQEFNEMLGNEVV